MTQDLGTAHQRFSETDIDTHIYVVGNEQNYHFQVLKLVLSKLGYEWASRIFHLSYGMVELPEGKMKSREGTVVDADDLIASMLADSKELSDKLGKLDELSDSGKEEIYRIIAMGALKFFILKVDPKKNMVFDPKESIDFNGNTGPFIQYTYARIRSILRKTDETVNYSGDFFVLNPREKQLMKHLYNYPAVLKEAAEKYAPSQIANFVYDLAKDYNQFYHECPVLKEQDYLLRQFRLELSGRVASVIRETMGLLGIEVPERM